MNASDYNYVFALHSASLSSALAAIASGLHIIVLDASGGFLHLCLEFAETPTDAHAHIAVGRFVFAPRAEGIGQGFTAIRLVFLEDIAGTDRDVQPIFFQERAAQPDAIEIVRRTFALQGNIRRTASAIKAQAKFPRERLLDVAEKIALPAGVTAREGVALVIEIRTGGIDRNARLASRIPIRPKRPCAPPHELAHHTRPSPAWMLPA